MMQDEGSNGSVPVPNAGNQERDPRQDAGQDASIASRLAKNPEDIEARLDNALDETMDASDPPEMTQPGTGKDPPLSSGYDEDAEEKRAADASHGQSLTEPARTASAK
jgi:hypothetical protein